MRFLRCPPGQLRVMGALVGSAALGVVTMSRGAVQAPEPGLVTPPAVVDEVVPSPVHTPMATSTVTTFRLTLLVYELLLKALDGDEAAFDELEGTWGEVIGAPFKVPATDRETWLEQASQLVAGLVTRGLEGSPVRLDSGVMTDHDPGLFLIGTTAPDLVGFAYYELATIINGRRPIERCEMCGRFFEVIDPRQRYCSKACAGRARSRRFRRKQSGNDS